MLKYETQYLRKYGMGRMPWELHKVEVQRKNLIDAFLNGEASMTELCKTHKISRKTAYKWLKRYIDGRGRSDLSDLSRAPKTPYKVFDAKLRRRTWGPRKILAKLKREYPTVQWPSATRLYEIFKSLHLVTPRRIRQRVPATHPLGDLKGANDVWMADFKGWFFTKDQKKCEPLTITDGYSRFLLKCEYVPKKSTEYVWPIYREAFLQYGLPARLRTDNGAPFGSRGAGRLTPLAVNLIKAGVMPEWIHPGHPEENGRHERLHLTLKQDIATPPADQLSEQIKKLKDFQEEYNFDRPHESLEMATPSCYYSKSARKWDGALRSPEYDTKEMFVRKVTPGGAIWIKQKEYYISSTISGEYVGIQEDGDGLNIYFGPVFLGRLTLEGGFKKPSLPKKPIIRRG